MVQLKNNNKNKQLGRGARGRLLGIIIIWSVLPPDQKNHKMRLSVFVKFFLTWWQKADMLSSMKYPFIALIIIPSSLYPMLLGQANSSQRVELLMRVIALILWCS